jgi:hypothetical protein
MPIDVTCTPLPLGVLRSGRTRVTSWTSAAIECWYVPSLCPHRSWKHHVHVTGKACVKWHESWAVCWILLGKSAAQIRVVIYSHIQHYFHQSAASSSSELDHQTCRGSSIGRACGSYLIRYSQPQGRGFEPLLRLFLHTELLIFFLRAS